MNGGAPELVGLGGHLQNHVLELVYIARGT